MKHSPRTWAQERAQPHQIEKGPRVLVVRIDEGKLDFIAPGKLANDSRLGGRMNPSRMGERRKHFTNQKADRLVVGEEAVRVSVDGIHQNLFLARTLPSKGRRNHRRRKTTQGTNLDSARWSEDADECGKKEAVTKVNRSGSSGVILDRAQKSDLLRRRTLFFAIEKLGEKPILCFVIVE